MEWLYNNGIGTIVICSGEFNNEGRTEFIENIIHNTIDKSKEIDKGLRVWFLFVASPAGKEGRLLGRCSDPDRSADGRDSIEYWEAILQKRSEPVLPANGGDGPAPLQGRVHSRERIRRAMRVAFCGVLECRNLKKMMKMGYEVYSGTIVGLPFQTDENLVEDILGMKELGVDGLE